MGYHFSCVSMQMWNRTYTNAQSVSHLRGRSRGFRGWEEEEGGYKRGAEVRNKVDVLQSLFQQQGLHA